MTVSTKRTKPATTLEDRLAAEAERLRQEAAQLSANIERGQLLRQPRQTDAATSTTAWINSRGLRPPE